MKKIILNNIRLFSMLAVAALTLASCEKDDDSNPTFHKNTTGFVLNTPANATNNTYDLAFASTLNLTCSQPDFGGAPYVTDYYVQVSLDPTFKNATSAAPETKADFIQLASSYTTASMNVLASEVNNAMIQLYRNAHGDVNYPSETRPLYVRLLATPVTMNNTVLDSVYSNVIELPKVLATYVAPEVTFPQELYIVGSSIGVDGGGKLAPWTYWKKFAPVYGNAPKVQGDFYSLVYFTDDASFKFGEAEQDWQGYDQVGEFDDQAKAGITKEDGGNIHVAKGGWYLIYVTTKLTATKAVFTFHIFPAHAYVMGAAAGAAWIDGDADWEMTAPADANGIWESPAFTASGELRAYIKVPGLDWWKTEFTLYKGNCFWRTMDLPDNWAKNAGPEYSVACSAGQKLHVNFNLNTGEVK